MNNAAFHNGYYFKPELMNCNNKCFFFKKESATILNHVNAVNNDVYELILLIMLYIQVTGQQTGTGFTIRVNSLYCAHIQIFFNDICLVEKKLKNIPFVK